MPSSTRRSQRSQQQREDDILETVSDDSKVVDLEDAASPPASEVAKAAWLEVAPTAIGHREPIAPGEAQPPVLWAADFQFIAHLAFAYLFVVPEVLCWLAVKVHLGKGTTIAVLFFLHFMLMHWASIGGVVVFLQPSRPITAGVSANLACATIALVCNLLHSPHGVFVIAVVLCITCWCVALLPFSHGRLAGLCYMFWSILLQAAFAIGGAGLRSFTPWISAGLAGIFIPVGVALYEFVGFHSARLWWYFCRTRRHTDEMFSCLCVILVQTSEGLKLGELLYTWRDGEAQGGWPRVVSIAVAVIGGSCCEIAWRSGCLHKFLSFACGVQCETSPQRDRYLRAKLLFGCPAFVGAAVVTPGLIFGTTAWSRTPGFWLLVAVALAFQVLTDLVVVLLHKRDRETFRHALCRLQLPGGHAERTSSKVAAADCAGDQREIPVTGDRPQRATEGERCQEDLPQAVQGEDQIVPWAAQVGPIKFSDSVLMAWVIVFTNVHVFIFSFEGVYGACGFNQPVEDCK